MFGQKSDACSYDQVPYRSWPYVQSHPDRLASMATLFGIRPQPIEQARVLELACAAGGNLIPMAEMLPQSSFVGIDLSARELAEGVALVKELGLENIKLLHMNITDVSRDLGEFDYIIAHGVYSWVTDDVQNKILSICRENLDSNGVAYISYNTYPGWRMRGMIRDMVVYHSGQFGDPPKRVEQARALLNFLVESVPVDNNPYGAYLRQELDLFNRVEDHYLYHDHLEGVNEPVYFHQFIRRAERHGLQYLGETDLSIMATSTFGSEIEATLDRISRDIIQVEQYMDFLRLRTFRQTLLCHQHHRVDRSLSPGRVAGLYFASNLKPQQPIPDVRSSDNLAFAAGKLNVHTADPLIKAALLELCEAWPRWIAFDSLLDAARSRCDVQSDRSEAARHLGEHLIRCYASNAVELHASSPKFVTEVSDRPMCSPLMRLQARSGRVVTNGRHETVTLDDVGRHTVRILDGTRDLNAVSEQIRRLIERGELVVQSDGQPVTDLQRIETIIGEVQQSTLARLARTAMLVR